VAVGEVAVGTGLLDWSDEEEGVDVGSGVTDGFCVASGVEVSSGVFDGPLLYY
jgi:hypothetical protein